MSVSRVLDVVFLVPGPVGVRHRLQGPEVAGALELEEVQLGADVQGGGE